MSLSCANCDGTIRGRYGVLVRLPTACELRAKLVEDPGMPFVDTTCGHPHVVICKECFRSVPKTKRRCFGRATLAQLPDAAHPMVFAFAIDHRQNGTPAAIMGSVPISSRLFDLSPPSVYAHLQQAVSRL